MVRVAFIPGFLPWQLMDWPKELLSAEDSPFLEHGFLFGLEETGCRQLSSAVGGWTLAELNGFTWRPLETQASH